MGGGVVFCGEKIFFEENMKVLNLKIKLAKKYATTLFEKMEHLATSALLLLLLYIF